MYCELLCNFVTLLSNFLSFLFHSASCVCDYVNCKGYDVIVDILTVYILCKIVGIAKRNKTRVSKPTEMGEISIDSIVNTQYLLITLISGQLPNLLCNTCNTIDPSHFVSTPKFEPILQ